MYRRAFPARRVGHSSSRPQPQRTAKVRLRKKAAIVYLVKCLSSKEEKSVQFRLAAHKYAFLTISRVLFNYFISLKITGFLGNSVGTSVGRSHWGTDIPLMPTA